MNMTTNEDITTTPEQRTPRWKPKEPETYDGTRDAVTLRTFTTSLKMYFQLAQVPANLHVAVAMGYLKGAALTWFLKTQKSRGEELPTYAAFEAALIQRFMPPNHDNNILARWKNIHQDGSVHDYSVAF